MGRVSSIGQIDSFGSAEEVTAREALLRGLPVGFGSRLPGSMPTPPRRRPEPVGLVNRVRLRCLRIFVDDAAEDRAALDPGGVEVNGRGWWVWWSLVE